MKTEVREIMNKESFKGFYRFTDTDYLNFTGMKCSLKEQFNIVQQVPDEGVEYEFMISFYSCGNKLNARVEIFDDAFAAFDKHSELFEKLSKCKAVSPDGIEKLLISLGYINLAKEGEKDNGK